ncbi:uncharacterized protein LOC130755438 [Actinidia eriantha]|uniref:uncharacterized protein LOC130755438 n=1 Tax=Actinidia eriantha TaxID=165200 RepID=UPI0025830026|nr:uncharacterized protein LOC130755438 [Actinidia eriantha]
MGNCIRKEPPMQWAGEDWGSPAPEPLFSSEPTKIEEFRLLEDPEEAPKTEVKIKVTKKQLEELLGRVEVQGMSVHQLLAQLMSASDPFESHQRSWRPQLQSIPEGNSVNL